jgi:uncharacterized membrane protein
MLAVNPDAAMHRIVIVPNRSLSVTGLWLFYASIVALTAALGLWFEAEGFWPILVYAIVEMLLLGLCLLVCWQQGHDGEVITVSSERVLIDKRHGRHMQHREFDRYWAHLVVSEPATRLHPRRLYIRSHGRQCEIGRCLTETERQLLELQLAGLLGPLGKTGSS